MLRQKILAAISLPQDFERKMEEGINRALSLLNIPSREEVRNLQNRLDDLLKRCEALANKAGNELTAEENSDEPKQE